MARVARRVTGSIRKVNWNPLDHPRNPANGRFVRKGSPEAAAWSRSPKVSGMRVSQNQQRVAELHSDRGDGGGKPGWADLVSSQIDRKVGAGYNGGMEQTTPETPKPAKKTPAKKAARPASPVPTQRGETPPAGGGTLDDQMREAAARQDWDTVNRLAETRARATDAERERQAKAAAGSNPPVAIRGAQTVQSRPSRKVEAENLQPGMFVQQTVMSEGPDGRMVERVEIGEVTGVEWDDESEQYNVAIRIHESDAPKFNPNVQEGRTVGYSSDPWDDFEVIDRPSSVKQTRDPDGTVTVGGSSPEGGWVNKRTGQPVTNPSQVDIVRGDVVPAEQQDKPKIPASAVRLDADQLAEAFRDPNRHEEAERHLQHESLPQLLSVANRLGVTINSPRPTRPMVEQKLKTYMNRSGGGTAPSGPVVDRLQNMTDRDQARQAISGLTKPELQQVARQMNIGIQRGATKQTLQNAIVARVGRRGDFEAISRPGTAGSYRGPKRQLNWDERGNLIRES